MEVVERSFVDLAPKTILFSMVKEIDDFLRQGKLTNAIMLDGGNDDEATIEALVRPNSKTVDR